MKIAMISPILAATPPRATGPQEQVVSLLTEALVERGHEVILYATGDSHTSADLRFIRERAFDAAFPGRRVEHGNALYQHALIEHTVWALADAARSGVDVVHTHRPIGLLGHRAFGLPHVHTVHHGSEMGSEAALAFNRSYLDLFAGFPGIELVAVSASQRRVFPDDARIRVIHNAVDFGRFEVGTGPRDYLLFIGRMIPAKGAHLALDVSLLSGIPLKIAAALDEQHCDLAYYRNLVEPRIDGRHIEYVGEASAESRVGLYGGARALVNPIQWEEPFGLTMLESMACGTPVLAYRRGAAPELIEEGLSGHLVDDLATMVARARAPAAFDAARIRAFAEERFSVDRMVAAYEEAYRDAVARGGASR